MEKIAELFLKIYPIEGVSVKKRILFHSLFWLMMFLCLWQILGVPGAGTNYNFVMTSYFISLDIIFFYIITYITLPWWTNYYQYKLIGTVLCIFILIASLFIIFYLSVQVTFDYNLLKGTKVDVSFLQKFYKNYRYFFESGYVLTGIVEILLTSLPAFHTKLTLSLIKSYSEKKQTEIDYLRSQINPHFLTNTLNNIYSLSVTDDKRNSDAILSLSSLLDYVLYESNQPTISLEKEVSFLSNFIELEKMRNTKRLQVNFETEGDIHGNIPPMILITFVENAFKHCIGDLNTMCFINIHLKIHENTLHFRVENSKSNLVGNSTKKTFGGIGLTNVKKRLANLFPNTHYLQIENQENLFIIKLQLGLI